MPQFAEIILSNTNLTGSTNFFTLDMKECSQNTFTTIETGLTYSDFPYFVDLNEHFGPIDCFNYELSESLTGLICSGQTFSGTPTPTPSTTTTPTPTITATVTPSITPSVTTTTTPTPTPSLSPQSGETLSMGVEYESGSTVAIYSFTHSQHQQR